MARPEVSKRRSREYSKCYHAKHRTECLAKMKLYQAKNKERLSAQRKEWRKNNKELVKSRNRINRDLIRNHALKTKYGITLEERDKLLKDQEGCCAICRKPEKQCNYKLHVDHDHETGYIRGLLCRKCNAVLGMALESIEVLDAAKHYLTKSKEIQWQSLHQQ